MGSNVIIAGYNYGQPSVARSPLSLEELAELKKSLMFTEEDATYLRMAGDVLEDQVEQILDLWYGFVGSQPHLVKHFLDPQGNPIQEYLARVRKRFGQWILDTCRRPHDQDWLNYQYEMGLRHHRTKKNQTDGVRAATEVVPLRHLIALIVPITLTIKAFLAKKGHSDTDVERMYNAWFKAVTLQVALWSQPYTKAGDY
jgi:hypothetical protein